MIIKATEDCVNPPKLLKINKPEALAISSEVQDKSFIVRYKSNTGKYYDRFKHSRNLRSIIDIDDDNPEYQEYTGNFEIPEDNTLVKVFVKVHDVNDNPPKFENKIFTGGVTTSSDFGTSFMNIKAYDPDEGINSKIYYYQIGDIQRTLSEGLENIPKSPFLVDINTGEILLNFDPQKGMKGYFDFMVLANDTDGLQDIAHVFIYLLREDQRVRFVLRQQPPELREKIYLFRE